MGELMDAFLAKGPEPGMVESAEASSRYPEGWTEEQQADYVEFLDLARQLARSKVSSEE